jgi:exonuclease III
LARIKCPGKGGFFLFFLTPFLLPQGRTNSLSRTKDLNTRSIFFLNCKGLNNPDKRKSLLELTKRDDIICLQETHSTEDSIQEWLEFKRKRWLASHGNNRSRGTITLNRTNIVWSEESSWQGRITSTIFNTLFGKKLRIINVYAPNVNGSKASIACYKEFTAKITEILDDPMPTIIGGDINIIMNPALDAGSRNPSSHFPQLVDAWDQLLTKYNLKDAWRELHPDEQTYTFTPGGEQGRQIYRRLDYIFMSDELLNWIDRIDMAHTHISDHKFMRITLRPRKTRPPFRIWRHKDNLLTSPEYVNELTQATVEALADAQALSSHRARWEFTKYKIRQKARALEKKIFQEERQEMTDLQRFLNANMGNDIRSEEKRAALIRLKELDEERLGRLRLASRVSWYENDEQSTSFFYNRIKQGQANSNVVSLKSGTRVLEEQEVNHTIHSFYSDLYQSRGARAWPPEWNAAIDEMKKLQGQELEALGRPITLPEIENTLFKGMKKGKAPGNDGLTIEVYRALWKTISLPLMSCYEESIKEGMLPPSQRQSIIRLIKKKDRDPSDIKNWRPISLMNVDSKLLSCALANRLKPLIPKIISKAQLGFVQGRLITDGTKLIRLLMEDLEANKGDALFAAVDFEKAFDSIEHSYIRALLDRIGLPPYFTHCFSTLYQGAEASVINNSLTTPYFPVTRSCRQGDPIAPYLFILAVDPLLRKITNDAEVFGVRAPEEEIKLTAYADDICLTVRDGDALDRALAHVRAFGNFSGLKINEAKTEILQIGNPPLIGDILTKRQITVTGVTFGTRKDEVEKANFDKPLAKMKALLRLWQQRGLSLKGRALAAKTQGLTQLMYLSQTLEIPEWVHKEANTAIYNFIWKGPDKVSRKANLSDDERSLKVIDTRTMNALHAAQNLGFLNSGARWVQFLRRDIRRVSTDINKSTKRYKASGDIINFMQNIISGCQQLQLDHNASVIRENSTLANNFAFLDNKLKPLDFPRLNRKGYVRLEHVLRQDRVPSHTEVDLTYLEKLEWTKLTRYINPTIERSAITFTGTTTDPDAVVIMFGDNKLKNNELTYRALASCVRGARQFPNPPAWSKGELHAQNEGGWLCKRSYKRWGFNSKFLDFCHRWQSGLLYARKQLHRFGIKDSPACQMCGEDPQTVEHLFWYCPEINIIKEAISTSLGFSHLSLIPARDEFIPHLTARLSHCLYLENIQSPAIIADKVITRFHQYLDLEKIIYEKNQKTALFLDLWGPFHRPIDNT